MADDSSGKTDCSTFGIKSNFCISKFNYLKYFHNALISPSLFTFLHHWHHRHRVYSCIEETEHLIVAGASAVFVGWQQSGSWLAQSALVSTLHALTIDTFCCPGTRPSVCLHPAAANFPISAMRLSSRRAEPRSVNLLHLLKPSSCFLWLIFHGPYKWVSHYA